MSQRRLVTAALLAALTLGASMAPAQAPAPAAGKGELSILILGGTRFLGPHLVDAARARGHQVTLFNRGRSNPGMFPNLETLIGDRDPQKGAGLSALEGRRFDAVIDTSGYVPRLCRASAKLLAPQTEHYVFISTISVYEDRSRIGMDEDSPVSRLEDETTESVTGATYGALKALCEEAVEEEMPGRVAIVRPGLIVGPLDSSDRFTYWPARMERGGEVLSPGSPKDLVQFIDVRDLATWTIRLVEERTTGVFNAVGPGREYSIGELLQTCSNVAGKSARLVWVDAEFLDEFDVAPWTDMPVWIPPVGPYAGIGTMSNARAVAAGLRFRSAEDTVRDTLEWYRSLPPERRSRLRAGIAYSREQVVLEKWHERGGKAENAAVTAP